MSNQVKAFPQETTDYIADRFRDYYRRKKKGNGLTPREAKMLIDHVSGPAPVPGGVSGVDYSRPVVSGGGAVRPTDGDVQALMEKQGATWDPVFDELLFRLRYDRDAESLIKLYFRDNHSDLVVCDELGIGRTTFYRQRLAILNQAGVIAVQIGVLNPWKY